MRKTKKILGRDIQFRLEWTGWHKSMTFHVIPSIEVLHMAGWGMPKHKIFMPGFWNIQFGWLRCEFTICINDKEK